MHNKSPGRLKHLFRRSFVAQLLFRCSVHAAPVRMSARGRHNPGFVHSLASLEMTS